MKEDVEAHVCLSGMSARQDREEKGSWINESLSIPYKPWKGAFLDFLSVFPKSKTLIPYGVSAIFSKYAVFMPMLIRYSTDQVTQLFFKNIVKHWGKQEDIISDWDTRFTSNHWTVLNCLLGSELKFSPSIALI